MTNILNSNLGYQAIKKLAEEDFLGKAILSYYEQEKSFSFEKVDKGNKEVLLQNLKKLSELKKSYDRLVALLEEDFKTKFDDTKNKFNLNTCASYYICKNFYKLCPNVNQVNSYKKIYKIGRMLYKNYNVTLNAAILLRTEKIMKELYFKSDIDAVNKLLDLIEELSQSNYEILYMVYFRLYNEDNRCLQKRNRINDEITKDALLNSEDILPDSIIKELCLSSQFKEYDAEKIMLVMSTFFENDMKIPYVENDKIDNINLLFKNNLRDLDSKAEFLDLEPLFDFVEKGDKKGYKNFVFDMLVSNEQLIEYEDIKDGKYGSIK